MTPDSRLKRLALWTSAIFLLIVGTLLNVQQMYLMATAIALIPVAFWLVGYFLQFGVTCRRTMPSTCERGERVPVYLSLFNPTVFPRFYLRAYDMLPRWVRFDGDAGDDGGMQLTLGRNERQKLVYFIRPLRRGRHNIGPTKLSNPDMLGTSVFAQTVNDLDELLVYPAVVPVSLQFFGGGVARGWRDQDRATIRGPGSEFQGVREYQTGDDLRRVNWKATARTGALAVTEYTGGYSNDLTIALDLSEDSYNDMDDRLDSAFEVAIEIAASVSVSALRLGSTVQFITNGSLLGLDGLLRGTEQIPRVLTALALAAPMEAEFLSDSITSKAVLFESSRSVIVITGGVPSSGGFSQDVEDLRSDRHASPPTIFWIDRRLQSREQASATAAEVEIFEDGLGKNIVVRSGMSVRSLFAGISL
jgi:uncharacterized protein (DUF58 family)